MTALHAPAHALVKAPAPTCLYCRGRDLELAYSGVRDRLGHVPGERSFWRCRDCKSLVLVPLPRTEELPAFYPPVYTFGLDSAERSFLKRCLAQLEYSVFFRTQYRGQTTRILKHLARSGFSGRRLLDLGCGRGMRLLEFRARGWHVEGADLVPDTVYYLRDKLGIPAVCADLTEVADLFPADSFDLVTAFHLFEHVPQLSKAFDTCFQLLKPGGWVAVAIPMADTPGIEVLDRRWISLTEAPRHVSIPSRRGLLTAAASAGFECLTVIPDHPLLCASMYALSAMPSVNATATAKRSPIAAWAARLFGAFGAVAGLGLIALERLAGSIPGAGILLARKPGGGGP